MLAARIHAPGRMRLEEVADPRCPDTGLLIRVKACGICAADKKMMLQGHRALSYPRILGHEISGEVAESRHADFGVGDRVQVAPGLSCGKCPYCLRGMDNQCEKREIFGFTVDGGFAQYLAVPLQGAVQGRATHLPGNISFPLATLAEPIACCLNGFSKMPLYARETVVVLGAGPLGLLNVLIAKAQGTGKLIVSEPRGDRRAKAHRLGATRSFDPGQENLHEVVNEESNGKGADVLILASPLVGLQEGVLQAMARGGRISVFSGLPGRWSQPGLDLNLVHYNELMITGAYGCTAAQNAAAIDFISTAKDRLQELITGNIALGSLGDMFYKTDSRGMLKTIVEV